MVLSSSQKLFVLSAPSGSGKTTLVKHLLGQKLPLEFSISATSRTPRKGEKEGKDYYFLSAGDFRKHIEQKDFLEWEEVYEQVFYGTLKSEVNRIWKMGKQVIFDIDVMGGLQIKRMFPKQTFAIFIKAPNIATMKTRLITRGTDSKDTIDKRLEKVSYEMGFAEQFDHILVNDDLETAKKEITHLVRKKIQS